MTMLCYVPLNKFNKFKFLRAWRTEVMRFHHITRDKPSIHPTMLSFHISVLLVWRFCPNLWTDQRHTAEKSTLICPTYLDNDLCSLKCTVDTFPVLHSVLEYNSLLMEEGGTNQKGRQWSPCCKEVNNASQEQNECDEYIGSLCVQMGVMAAAYCKLWLALHQQEDKSPSDRQKQSGCKVLKRWSDAEWRLQVRDNMGRACCHT